MRAVGSRGYYGFLKLSIVPREDKDPVRVLFKAKGAEKWRDAATAGIDYALARTPLDVRRGISSADITVEEIRWHETDTNRDVMYYLGASACWKALAYRPPQPPRQDESGHFVYPE